LELKMLQATWRAETLEFWEIRVCMIADIVSIEVEEETEEYEQRRSRSVRARRKALCRWRQDECESKSGREKRYRGQFMRGVRMQESATPVIDFVCSRGLCGRLWLGAAAPVDPV
jgi:hypothetical protein